MGHFGGRVARRLRASVNPVHRGTDSDFALLTPEVRVGRYVHPDRTTALRRSKRLVAAWQGG